MSSRTDMVGVAWDIFLFCAAVFLFVVAGRYASYGEGGGIGPDFWPRVVLALMAAAALADLILRGITLRRKTTSPAEPRSQSQTVDAAKLFAVIGAMAALIAYVALLPYVGFYLTTIVFIPIILMLAAYRSLWIIAIGVLGTTALTYLFQAWLGSNFPIGRGVFERATIVIYHALHIF